MALVDIVGRATWRMPGSLGPAKVELPCRGLWLHHAAGSYRDDRDLAVHDDVFSDARTVARTGINRFGRASYSWFTSPASPRGQVLEMQGHWIGAHTATQNSSSHGLCVMGNFQLIEPDGDLLWTIAATSAHGYLEGWWPQPELLGGHRDAPGAATACPGSHLHDAIPDINQLARQLAQEDDMALFDNRDDFEKAVQDAIFKAGFGRANPESFGDRVGHIRVDTRATRTVVNGLTAAVQSLSEQVDAIADGDKAGAHACGTQVRQALAQAGEALAALDDE